MLAPCPFRPSREGPSGEIEHGTAIDLLQAGLTLTLHGPGKDDALEVPVSNPHSARG